MEEILNKVKSLHVFRSLDIQFARMLATSADPALMLASACLSADYGSGHICMPLTLLTPSQLFNGQLPELAKQAWLQAGGLSLDEWEKCLLASSAVSDGSRPTPLVIDNQRLYLHRMWQYECTVAQFFNRPQLPVITNETVLAKVLTHYFPKNSTEIDWQKIAAAVAITRQVAIISGGPGTGKTYMVAKLLVILLKLNHNKRIRILITAPTGKAAARLNEAISLAMQHSELNERQKWQLPSEAITLHCLLGEEANSQKLCYHRKNLLHVDTLIIDEASMIDLPMMANLIMALPTQAQIIFLGDRCQLSSIEAGGVLSDICQFAEIGYSNVRRDELMRLTGFMLPVNIQKYGYNISDSLCLLQKNYRFDKESDINQLAKAINAGDVKNALALLNTDATTNIMYTQLREITDYQRMIHDCVKGYQDYLIRMHNRDAPAIILDAFNRFRLLCALREGPFGVVGLNYYVELALRRAGLLNIRSIGLNYAGRPVMILCNAPSLRLYNGDIGILLLDDKQILRAYFFLSDGRVKSVSLNRLPKHETVFAMTVHKSQGLAFDNIALVLPNQIFPILTRELLYTAITRARVRLSIYAIEEILSYAIMSKNQRRSGLIERLAVKQTAQ